MPKHQEQKYRVDNFDEVIQKLEALGATKGQASTSMHYYVDLPSNDVVKLVVRGDHCEIHVLGESEGKFTLKENVHVENLNAGLNWLEKKGYTEVRLVKMQHTDYSHKEGIVGLYIINDSLRSIILDYPNGQHAAIAKELGMENAETISEPYNKYLQRLGQLKAESINSLLKV